MGMCTAGLKIIPKPLFLHRLAHRSINSILPHCLDKGNSNQNE
jgi:hypothetical protein